MNTKIDTATITATEYYRLKKFHEEFSAKISDTVFITVNHSTSCYGNDYYDQFAVVGKDEVVDKLTAEICKLRKAKADLKKQFDEQSKQLAEQTALAERWKGDAVNSTGLIKSKHERLMEIQSKWWYKLFYK